MGLPDPAHSLSHGAMANITQAITEQLHSIEQTENVRILYACESGSRAWGFASRDSDYDVRFIYIRPPEWYLRIDLETQSDVIELPISGELDINGWDIRKALNLLRKSNPPLLEWLCSPTIYLDQFDFRSRLARLAAEYYAPVPCAFHYLHMARGNNREFLQGELVNLKKYLYVLRPLLAVKWIESERDPAPTEFEALLDWVQINAELKQNIRELVQRKKAGNELGKEPKIPAISDFISAELLRLENFAPRKTSKPPSLEPLNLFFREMLRAVYPK
jgi:uncharacterized protein